MPQSRRPHAPPSPSARWLLRHGLRMPRDPLGFLNQALADHGDVVRLPFPKIGAWIFVHPDHIRHILQENHKNYDKRTFGYGQLRLLMGEGLLTSDGAFWLRQRRIAQPAFHRQRLATLGDQMVRAAEDAVARWHDASGTQLNIAQEMLRLTLRTFGEALLSVDLTRDVDTLGRAVRVTAQEILVRALRPVNVPLSLPTPANRRFLTAKRVFDDVIAQMVAARRASAQRPNDLLTMLMEVHDQETGDAMTDRQLRDNVLTIIIAGHETTANALTWTFYLLSKAPGVARRLRDEVRDVLKGRSPTVADLDCLSYCKSVLHEALRLYPPVWNQQRSAIADDEIDGYRIPAGTQVVMLSYCAHRHRAFWDEPEEFNPDRFAPEAVARRPGHAYLPFGSGPRMCIGSNLAMMAAQLILATLAQRFRLDLAPGHNVEVEAAITLRPRHGLPMAIHAW